MGFFQDLKEDLSQAVTELVPDEAFENTEEGGVPTESAQSAPEEGADKASKEITSEDLADMLNALHYTGMQEKGTKKAEEAKKAKEVKEPTKAAALKETEKSAEEKTKEPKEEKKVTQEPEQTEAESFPEFEQKMEQEIAMSEESNMDVMLSDIKSEMQEGDDSMDVQFTDRGREVLDETAVVTSGMRIKGDIDSAGSLDVIGTIEGNIDILGKLNITGTIQGNSKAAEVYAEGANIMGEIVSEGTIKIGQSSVIIGNLTATSAVIAGAVKGDIDVKGPVILDASAIVMGNIKSKSVQINNGAVIEGLCSQCYADVNPTSFFDDIKKAAKK